MFHSLLIRCSCAENSHGKVKYDFDDAFKMQYEVISDTLLLVMSVLSNLASISIKVQELREHSV